MAKTKTIDKLKKVTSIIKEWKEVFAIFISIGALIYTISSYKTELENSIKDKITEDEVRTLIELENSDIKKDIRDIRNYLLTGQIPD